MKQCVSKPLLAEPLFLSIRFYSLNFAGSLRLKKDKRCLGLQWNLFPALFYLLSGSSYFFFFQPSFEEFTSHYLAVFFLFLQGDSPQSWVRVPLGDPPFFSFPLNPSHLSPPWLPAPSPKRLLAKVPKRNSSYNHSFFPSMISYSIARFVPVLSFEPFIESMEIFLFPFDRSVQPS